MQIYGPTNVHGAHPVNTPHTSRVSSPSAPSASAQIQDELSLSDAARLASAAQQLPEIREDRVAALRAQIASGTYETPERLSGALDGLLDEIG